MQPIHYIARPKSTKDRETNQQDQNNEKKFSFEERLYQAIKTKEEPKMKLEQMSYYNSSAQELYILLNRGHVYEQ